MNQDLNNKEEFKINENVKEDRAAYCPIFLFNAWEGWFCNDGGSRNKIFFHNP